MVKAGVLRDNIAAVSAGIYAGEPVLDLDYAEDSDADADANFVMTGEGGIVEVQGTAEKEPFDAGAVRRADAARTQGHRRARFAAEADGRLMTARTRNAGSSSRPTIPARSPRSTTWCAPYRPRCGVGGRPRAARAGGDRASPSPAMRASRPWRPPPRPACRRCRTIPASRSNALGGEPGIYSARWAGPAKDFGLAMRKVADEVERREGWTAAGPRANFTCALCLAWPDGAGRAVRGQGVTAISSGRRAAARASATIRCSCPTAHELTFGEMEPDAKHAISHRARAFARFVARLPWIRRPVAAGCRPAR